MPSKSKRKVKRMAKYDALCEQVYNDVDGALAVGLVDYETGEMIGIYHEVAYFSQDYVDMVSEQAVLLFNGAGIKNIEDNLSKMSGKSRKKSIQEVYMKTGHTQHFMVAIPKVNAVIVLVTSTAALAAKGWLSVRGAVGKI